MLPFMSPLRVQALDLSRANHIQDVHTGHDNLFPKCLHKRLQGRKWIKPNTKATQKVEAIVTNKGFVKDVEKLSTLYQTFALEAFHSVVIHFAPKSTAFSYFGMTTRLQLAALHYNENCKCEQATTSDGVMKYDMTFLKYKKGGHIVKKVLEEQTFNYVAELIEVTLQLCKIEESTAVPLPPPPLSKAFERPEKTEAVR